MKKVIIIIIIKLKIEQCFEMHTGTAVHIKDYYMKK